MEHVFSSVGAMALIRSAEIGHNAALNLKALVYLANEEAEDTEVERNTLAYLLEALIRKLRAEGIYNEDSGCNCEVCKLIDKSAIYLQKIADDKLPF